MHLQPRLACSALSGPCFQPSASPVAHPEAAPFQAAGHEGGRRRETVSMLLLDIRHHRFVLYSADGGHQAGTNGGRERRGPSVAPLTVLLAAQAQHEAVHCRVQPSHDCKGLQQQRQRRRRRQKQRQRQQQGAFSNRLGSFVQMLQLLLRLLPTAPAAALRHCTADPPWPNPSPLPVTLSTAHSCACASSSLLQGETRRASSGCERKPLLAAAAGGAAVAARLKP
jgi:hypothetical protein